MSSECHWWLMIWVPGELHLYEVGDVSPDDLAAVAQERTQQHNVPEDWLSHPGYSVTLSCGEPHQDRLDEAATITRLET